MSTMTVPEAAAGPEDLTGKVALVTGGASGIGAATVRALARRGAAVAVDHRGAAESAESAEALAAEVKDAGGGAVAVRADATDPDDVAWMVAETEARLGPVDVLVLNAAGVGGSEVRRRPFADTAWEDIERIVLAQLRAVFHTASAVLPGMAERGAGSVVAVGAAMSGRAAPGLLPVGMAKSAVECAVKTLAAEYGPSGVRVNAVAPGLILSAIGGAMPEKARAANAERAALRRNGTPEDVADLIAFLASDQARYLTGCHLVADGGTAMP